MTYDVAVVGGGIIGAACADALAGEGLSVCLVEAGPFAREATWASAGILHPIHPWTYPAPLQPLLRASLAEWERVAPELRARSGHDVEMVRCGLVVMEEGSERLAEWCGVEIEHRRVRAREILPSLRTDAPALFLPRACHVRPQRVARAYLESARRRGAALFEHRPVTAIRDDGVETAAGPVAARRVLVCAGAWSVRLLPRLLTVPVRGQMLLYRGRLPHMVILPGGAYAVPRRDGLVLFGSTVERAGFDARPTEGACRGLAASARDLLGLTEDDQIAAWAGLRPGTDHLLPYMGPDPSRPDALFHACGHFRNGILLAPLTARILADSITGRPTPFDLSSFLPRG